MLDRNEDEHFPASARGARRAWTQAGLLVAALGAVTLVAVGCPGSLDDIERFRQPTCGVPGLPACSSTTSTVVPTRDIVAGPFADCFGCHTQQTPQGNFRMKFDTDEAFEAAMRAGTSTSVICMGRRLVVPGQPEQSLLYLKITSAPGCGSRMPLGAPLSAANVELVRKWVEGLKP